MDLEPSRFGYVKGISKMNFPFIYYLKEKNKNVKSLFSSWYICYSLPGRKIRKCHNKARGLDILITPWLPCILYRNTSSKEDYSVESSSIHSRPTCHGFQQDCSMWLIYPYITRVPTSVCIGKGAPLLSKQNLSSEPEFFFSFLIS